MIDRTTTTEFGNEQEQDEMQQHEEGMTARAIEHQTAKLPSDTFLWAGLAFMGCSIACKVAGKDTMALFCGQFAPMFLMFGLYNKIVKVAGSDRASTSSSRPRVYVP